MLLCSRLGSAGILTRNLQCSRSVSEASTGTGTQLTPATVVHNLPVIMQITFAFTLIYIWCLAALKMSQLALYMRVFSRQLRVWVYGAGAIVVVWALMFNFLFIFLCDPISQQWTIERVGHCMDQILLL